ncbi:MAG: ABC-2 transporter permease [Firmicutes bacterium]|nr:ABC-2 transporter permease [[Eubacterium] siraeum]MCM1488432.1 ABC-2 transporter permease [Bacillota bacterium]
MKGLLLKDLYVAVKNLKIYFVLALVFIGAAVADKENIYFLYFPPALGGMIPVTLLAYDEKSRWTRYSLALPYSTNQIVSGKYIVGIAASSAASAVSAAIMLIIGYTAAQAAVFFVTGVSVSCVIPALCLPFSFKLGVEKGRLVYYAVLVLIAFLGGGIVENLGFSPITSLADITTVSAAAAALLYGLSWLASVRVVKNNND